MILTTSLVVSRDDAEKAGVVVVRDDYQFATEQEQAVYAENVRRWIERRPAPDTMFSFPPKAEPTEQQLLSAIDKMFGYN